MWMGRVSWIMTSLLRSGSVDHFAVARLVSALDRLAVEQGKDLGDVEIVKEGDDE